jgi:hypothetical protein
MNMSTWAEFLREKYVGKRVRLISMSDDPNPIKPGTEGLVESVDDLGHLHVKWDNGRTLSLIVNTDTFDVLD